MSAQEEIERKKQLYLQRVNQLYDHIQDWLKDEKLVLVPTEFDIVDALGTYKGTSLSIKRQSAKTLAEFRPRGTSVALTEGVINIEGWLGGEYLAYMVDGGPSLLKLNVETNEYIKESYYPAIKVDGWYWMEGTQKNNAHLMNKALLLKLIYYVSC